MWLTLLYPQQNHDLNTHISQSHSWLAFSKDRVAQLICKFPQNSKTVCPTSTGTLLGAAKSVLQFGSLSGSQHKCRIEPDISRVSQVLGPCAEQWEVWSKRRTHWTNSVDLNSTENFCIVVMNARFLKWQPNGFDNIRYVFASFIHYSCISYTYTYLHGPVRVARRIWVCVSEELQHLHCPLFGPQMITMLRLKSSDSS